MSQISLAGKLRDEVNQVLAIDPCVNLSEFESMDYDVLKEIVIKDGKTYRDILISHTAYRRNQNIDYWVSRAADWSNLTDTMVTDWRYPNELEYISNSNNINLVTVRLFRTAVEVPPGRDDQ